MSFLYNYFYTSHEEYMYMLDFWTTVTQKAYVGAFLITENSCMSFLHNYLYTPHEEYMYVLDFSTKVTQKAPV